MSVGFRVVCLCGSAGALSAYIDILRDMPIDTGMTFLVLTHRRGGRPCWLPEIIARSTRMSVQQVEDGTVFMPNHIYVMPPGTSMTTDGSTLFLAPGSTLLGWPHTFDIFLKSLAQSTYSRAVAVILSGMAGDGSAALAAIRTSGGITFAQTGADYSSMPDTAIDTGKVDFIGSASEIASRIAGLAAWQPRLPPAASDRGFSGPGSACPGFGAATPSRPTWDRVKLDSERFILSEVWVEYEGSAHDRADPGQL